MVQAAHRPGPSCQTTSFGNSGRDHGRIGAPAGTGWASLGLSFLVRAGPAGPEQSQAPGTRVALHGPLP